MKKINLGLILSSIVVIGGSIVPTSSVEARNLFGKYECSYVHTITNWAGETRSKIVYSGYTFALFGCPELPADVFKEEDPVVFSSHLSDGNVTEEPTDESCQHEARDVVYIGS